MTSWSPRGPQRLTSPAEGHLPMLPDSYLGCLCPTAALLGPLSCSHALPGPGEGGGQSKYLVSTSAWCM